MLCDLAKLRGCSISASDGDLGTVHDFYFDDHFWHVRYLVVDTGTWLPGRRVLISPSSIGSVLPESNRLGVCLTREQVKNSPDIDTNKPVSRQQETELTQYYGWPVYWDPPGAVGLLTGNVAAEAVAETLRDASRAADAEQDPNLRSVKEVTGYSIEAEDGPIGHVEDFVADDQNWIIRYLVVDTRNWLPGRKVLAWPQLISSVSWGDRKVRVGLDRETIKTSPAYDPSRPVARDYEMLLYQHYGQQGYWLDPSNPGDQEHSTGALC